MRGLLKSVVAASAALPLFVFAQAVADPFDTALATATTSTGHYASSLVGLAAVAVIFMIGVKYVKKLVRSS